jgi:4-hydroxy-tetrahydrodipicolinate synthase
VDAALENDFESARHLHEKFYPLFTTLFIESNPVPVKAVMKVMNIIADEQIRLPLGPLTEENRATLFSVTNAVGLTNI